MVAKTNTMTFCRQEFIRHLFSPKVAFNASEAYRLAYPNCKGGYNKLANRLMSKVDIKKEIAKKQALISRKTGMTIERVQKMYESDRRFAKQCNQAGARVSATTGIARLYGMDKDGGKPPVAVINVINYSGSAGVKPPPVIESEVIDE